MRIISPLSRSVPLNQAFSLIEMAIVVAILGIVAVLGLEVAANFVNRTAVSVSRERLVVADDAISQFFKIYGRLPCPAAKATSPTTNLTTYGLEDCTLPPLTGTTIGDGLLSGALPFRTLNLPMMFGLDGFNNKLNYVVTRNLTMAGGDAGAAPTSTKRFGTATTVASTANDGIAGIEIRSGILEQPCNTSKCQLLADPATRTGAAYVVFSSGVDLRGATSDFGAVRELCSRNTSGELRVDTQNCVFGDNTVRARMAVTNIPYNVFYDNRYNAGMNLSSYFDDVLIWRSKAQL